MLGDFVNDYLGVNAKPHHAQDTAFGAYWRNIAITLIERVLSESA